LIRFVAAQTEENQERRGIKRRSRWTLAERSEKKEGKLPEAGGSWERKRVSWEGSLEGDEHASSACFQPERKKFCLFVYLGDESESFQTRYSREGARRVGVKRRC